MFLCIFQMTFFIQVIIYFDYFAHFGILNVLSVFCAHVFLVCRAIRTSLVFLVYFATPAFWACVHAGCDL